MRIIKNFSITCLCLIAAGTLQAATHRMNADEVKLFALVAADRGQMRPSLKLDPILCREARKRAADMVARNYFNHTNPDGKTPNFLVTLAGYILPASYDKTANYIESIGRAPGTPGKMLQLWKGSSYHRTHLLASTSLYKDQTRIGIGVVRDKKAPNNKTFVFISAPPNLNPSPPKWVLKDNKGKIIATTSKLSAMSVPSIYQWFGAGSPSFE